MGSLNSFSIQSTSSNCGTNTSCISKEKAATSGSSPTKSTGTDDSKNTPKDDLCFLSTKSILCELAMGVQGRWLSLSTTLWSSQTWFSFFPTVLINVSKQQQVSGSFISTGPLNLRVKYDQWKCLLQLKLWIQRWITKVFYFLSSQNIYSKHVYGQISLGRWLSGYSTGLRYRRLQDRVPPHQAKPSH